jgi:hypothetical protein
VSPPPLTRQNVYAAPFDAMGYHGMQTNGAADVDQSLLGNVNANSGAGILSFVDGWRIQCGGAVAALSSAYSTVPPVGFLNSVRIYTTTAVAGALAAADFGRMTTYIEGYRCRRLGWGTANAQPITLAFWVYAQIAGTMALAVCNNANNRSYVANVVINNASTWEYKTVTIPGDTAGTWDVGNNAGLMISFCFGCGSTYGNVAANTWLAGNYFGTTATTNFFTTAGIQSMVGGVLVLPGNEAPSAARSPFIVRPYEQELALCQRYYEKSYNSGTAPGAAVGAGSNGVLFNATGATAPGLVIVTLPYRVIKRAAPTLTFYDGAGATGKCSQYISGVWTNGIACGGPGNSQTQTMMGFDTAAGATVSYVGFDFTADARL